jgi:alkanesulfonate monooxygenase SsuD/methylene tetrahydromethanopterin reductase-like flavin-dependent oxidoreductase (luciferase family)
VVGTPEQIADTLEEWFLSGAADGNEHGIHGST